MGCGWGLREKRQQNHVQRALRAFAAGAGAVGAQSSVQGRSWEGGGERGAAAEQGVGSLLTAHVQLRRARCTVSCRLWKGSRPFVRIVSLTARLLQRCLEWGPGPRALLPSPAPLPHSHLTDATGAEPDHVAPDTPETRSRGSSWPAAVQGLRPRGALSAGPTAVRLGPGYVGGSPGLGSSQREV